MHFFNNTFWSRVNYPKTFRAVSLKCINQIPQFIKKRIPKITIAENIFCLKNNNNRVHENISDAVKLENQQFVQWIAIPAAIHFTMSKTDYVTLRALLWVLRHYRKNVNQSNLMRTYLHMKLLFIRRSCLYIYFTDLYLFILFHLRFLLSLFYFCL